MADIDLKAATPDTTLPTTGFLFGADSQAASAPSVYSTQTVATTLLGSTSLTGATITTSQPVLDLAQTWNASGTTFTGLRFNATDTASAAASLLMDLQVGGTSQFRVSKAGRTTLTDITLWSNETPGGTTTKAIWAGPNATVILGRGGTAYVVCAGNGFGFPSANTLGWGYTSSGGTADLEIGRRAAANLRLGAADAAAPVAQTLSVQSVVAGTSNTAGANLTITGSQGTGTGAGGSIIFQTAPAGSSGTAQNALASVLQLNGAGGITGWDGTTANTLALRNGAAAQNFNVYNTHTSSTNYEAINIGWDSNNAYIGAAIGSGGGTRRPLRLFGSEVDFLIGTTTVSRIWLMNSSGHFLAGTDNNYDIGTSSGSRPRNIYAGTSITGPHRMTGTAPASAAATGTAGDLRYDADYVYICTATDTWKRVAIATWP